MVQRPTDARERRLVRRLDAEGRHRSPQLGLLLPLQDRRDHDHEHGKRCFPDCEHLKCIIFPYKIMSNLFCFDLLVVYFLNKLDYSNEGFIGASCQLPQLLTKAK